MNNKKILILPASIYQLPFIKRASEDGLFVITVDNQPENIGHVFSDISYNISTIEYDKIAEICLDHQVDGIISPCSDIALKTVAYVGEKMNIPSPGSYCVEVLTSKIMFRKFQKQHKLNHPEFCVYDDEDITVSYPFIIKPDRSSGSKGIFVIRTSEELHLRLEESMSYSLNGKVIIEKEIYGHHLTAEGTLYNGCIENLFISDRITAPVPYVATWGHIMPSAYATQSIIDNVHEQISFIFNKLQYSNGPFDADIVVDLTSQQVYILEVTPRVGGNSLTTLIRYAYGFDMIGYLIAYATRSSIKTTVFDKPKLTKVKLLGSLYPSIISYDVKYIDYLKECPNIKYINVEYKPGESVNPFINGRNRVGEVVIQGSTIEEINKIEYSLIDSQIKFIK